MKQVVWFEKEQFLIKTISEYLKLDGISLLGVSELTGYSYIVEDFSPDLIVLDWNFVSLEKDQFFKEWNSSENLRKLPVKFVLADRMNEEYKNYVSFVNYKGAIYKPIRMDQLVENLKQSN